MFTNVKKLYSKKEWMQNQENYVTDFDLQDILCCPQSITLATTQYPRLHEYFATQILPIWPQLLDPGLPPVPCTGQITMLEYSRYSRNFVYVKITGNRFCHAVQREHRSNNIYFRVEVPEFVFRQGCYDVSCNGVLSRAFPIPPEIFF